MREHGHLRPPDELRSAAYPAARRLGRGRGYVYPHDDEAGFDVDCLPDELKGRVYYEPSGIGAEVPVARDAHAQPLAADPDTSTPDEPASDESGPGAT